METFVLSVLVVVFAKMASCAPFILSEVFANGVGRGRDDGKEWLELTNLSQQPIIVTHLVVELHQGQGQPPLSYAVDLPQGLSFSDTLLIAQDKNLGLSECLKKDLSIVLVPGFKLANDGEQKICVEITDQQKTCAIIGKKTKRKDGVSLYRDLADQAERPWWKPEPCHLMDGIFATPGLSARACLSIPHLKDAIFDSCKAAHTPQKSPLIAQIEAKRGSIALTELQWTKGAAGDTTQLSFMAPSDTLEPLLLTPCSKPQKSEKICEVTGLSIVAPSGDPKSLSVPSPLVSPADVPHVFRVRSLDGRETHIDAAPRQVLQQETIATRWPFELKVVNVDTTHSQLLINVMQSHVPINVQILTEDGEILGQRAFVEAGQKKFEFTSNPSKPPLALKYFGALGNGAIPWPQTDRDLPNGCQHGKPSPLWWIAILWSLVKFAQSARTKHEGELT